MAWRHAQRHRGCPQTRSSRLVQIERLGPCHWRHLSRASRLAWVVARARVLCRQESNCTLCAWSRISKTMPKFLFHVIWQSIFAKLREEDEGKVVTALQGQYFYRCPSQQLWDAPCRSGVDCIMPGTDVGSAPQESWHKATLKEKFQCARKDPFSVAQTLHKEIIKPLLAKLGRMGNNREALEDWPSIGRFVDPHTLKNEAGLAKEGRTCAQKLLEWGLHSRQQDADGVFTEASRAPSIIVPGPDLQPVAAPLPPASSSTEDSAGAATSAVTPLLRLGGVGQYSAAFVRQGVTLEALESLTFETFHTIFNMTVGDAQKVLNALQHAGDSGSMYAADNIRTSAIVVSPYVVSPRLRPRPPRRNRPPADAALSHCAPCARCLLRAMCCRPPEAQGSSQSSGTRPGRTPIYVTRGFQDLASLVGPRQEAASYARLAAADLLCKPPPDSA